MITDWDIIQEILKTAGLMLLTYLLTLIVIRQNKRMAKKKVITQKNGLIELKFSKFVFYSTGFFGVAAIVSIFLTFYFWGFSVDSLYISGLLSIILFIGIRGLFGYFNHRVYYNQDIIIIHNFLGKMYEFQWENIRFYKKREKNLFLYIDEKKLTVWAALTGYNSFLEEVKEKCISK